MGLRARISFQSNPFILLLSLPYDQYTCLTKERLQSSPPLETPVTILSNREECPHILRIQEPDSCFLAGALVGAQF